MTYSSSLALSRSQFSGQGRNSVSFRTSERKFGPISNTIILIVLACLLGLLYLTQVTKTNAFGYTINQLQQQQLHCKARTPTYRLTPLVCNHLDRTQGSTVASAMVPVSPSGSVSQ